MDTKTSIDLGNIQETLLIPLWARAEEFKQENAMIRDRTSAEMVEAIDYNFAKFAQDRSTQVSCCLRGYLIDNWVKEYIQQYPQGVVVELGAGLNTRFERLDNGTIRWFDLDLADTMALRQKFFRESERRKFITASALDTDWYDLVRETASGKPCLFVAEGVLMYFTETEVKQLFANLSARFSGSGLAFDSLSPFLAKQHKPQKKLTAKFNWGIADIREIETWDSHYKLEETKNFWDAPPEYIRRFSWLNRCLFSLPFFRHSYRFALFSFSETASTVM